MKKPYIKVEIKNHRRNRKRDGNEIGRIRRSSLSSDFVGFGLVISIRSQQSSDSNSASVASSLV